MGCGSSSTLVQISSNSQTDQTTISLNDNYLIEKKENSEESFSAQNIYKWSKYGYTSKTGYIYKWIPVEERSKLHELIANIKEKERSKLDYDKKEEDEFEKHGLPPLRIPEYDNKNACTRTFQAGELKRHWLDQDDYFKYGRKVFSWKLMLNMLQERVTAYCTKYGLSGLGLSMPTYVWKWHSYHEKECPLDTVRRYVATRKELIRLLPVCQVGVWIDPPPDQLLEIMKKEIESEFEDLSTPEYYRFVPDNYESEYYGLLSRWLDDYPRHNVYNKPPRGNLDPNEQIFPLPSDTLAHLSVLRLWIDCWEPFDCKIPEDGAWRKLQPWNEQWPDANKVYFELIKNYHGDESLEPFNTTIEGDVAWIEIEMDLVKNDTTTEEQDEIWNKRAIRCNSNDPVRMAKRRAKLARSMKARYENKKTKYNFDQHINFVEVLEKHWKEFQQMCE